MQAVTDQVREETTSWDSDTKILCWSSNYYNNNGSKMINRHVSSQNSHFYRFQLKSLCFSL